jgi:hypothetical protein
MTALASGARSEDISWSLTIGHPAHELEAFQAHSADEFVDCHEMFLDEGFPTRMSFAQAKEVESVVQAVSAETGQLVEARAERAQA